ncbi:hypothetical protein RRF57_009762 [Xylaria bambusicola]|uniref:Uncharacterized protein n=1 Tax=Xylaria bambusicola TaxID=326684 RepID=A0AAN7UR49_9PEZI
MSSIMRGTPAYPSQLPWSSMHERRTTVHCRLAVTLANHLMILLRRASCVQPATLTSTSFSATIPDTLRTYLERARTIPWSSSFFGTGNLTVPSGACSRSHLSLCESSYALGRSSTYIQTHTYTDIMEYQAPTPSIQAAFAPESSPPPPPQPSQSQPQQQQQQQPITTEPFVGTSIKTMKIAAESSLRDYAALQKQGDSSGAVAGGNERLRAQGGLAASDLRALRSEVTAVLKRAQAERWRKWLLGGIVAAIIPAVRKIFRRSSSDDQTSSNDTEHAFRKSKSLIARILDSIHVEGKSGFASIAFFVLAVLYVFQNEVSLRVARTVSKRLKTLVSKVEDGVEDVGEQDFKILNGWRWRVLLW